MIWYICSYSSCIYLSVHGLSCTPCRTNNICCMAGSIWAITAAMISSVVATFPSLSDADAMIAIDIPPIQYSLGAMTC